TPNVVGEYKTAQQSADYVIRVVRDAAPAIEAKALELRADAIASAAVGYQGGIPTGDGMRHGTITNIGITNAAGSYVAGKQFTITLNGSAVFDENGKNTYTGTTATTPLTLNWSATANGVVDYSTTYENVYKKLAFIDRSGNVQQTLEYGGAGVSDPETVAGVTFKVVYDFQPMGTSNIQEITTDDGAFTDTFEAYADPAYGSGEWLKFDGTDTFVPVEYKVSAYYAGVTPPTQSGTVPQGADLVGTQYVTANSPGELSADFTATNAGFVTVVWEVVKVDQAEDAQKYIADDWADDYGLSAETISYRHEANIDSDLSIRTTKSGIYLVDDVWVTGMPDDHGTFTGDDRFVADTATLEQYVLFFPDGVDVVEANRGQAQKIGETVTIPAKNGFYPSVGHTSWKALTDDNGDLVVGTYVFITEFAGDDRVQPLVTSVEDVTEQYTVNPAVQPILKTTATDTVDGDKILDPTPNASITDKVCDVNKSLIPGKTYTIVTDVVLATDGTSVLTKKVTTSFTPKSADECAEIVIPFDGSDLAGQKVVVFESVYDGDKLIAIHHDLTDADQTVQFADKPAPKPNGSLAKTGVSIGGLSLATGVLLALG
ncbi:MAG: VaFE repeat-containing surface-anchored protein, partial [Arcanobacterium sp.]